MRISWRRTAVVLLAAVWPQLGCVHFPTDKTAQNTRPLDEKLGAAPKQALTAAEIAQNWQNKATALEQAGKVNDAMAAYEQVRQNGGPQAWNATKKIAVLADRTNDLGRAEHEYRLLLQQNPKDADILCNLGNIYYRRGLWNGADKFYRDAVFYRPDHKAAWAGLGWTLAQLGRHAESIECLQKVASKAEAYSNLATVLNLQGKRDDALRALQTAVDLEPNNAQVRADLAKMQASPPVVPQVVARIPPPVKRDQPGHVEPQSSGYMPPTMSANQRGNVELEDVPSVAAMNDGMSRLMQQRPTLPPLPDLDLTAGTGREWESSAKKKN